MAHLPQDELPSEFDVVVDGTGLVQSILAAALSRAGKSVLHLDQNCYYGELWASLMHREMQQWMEEHRSRDPETTPPKLHDHGPSLPPPYTPCEGERVLEIVRPHVPVSVSNLVETVHTEVGESGDGKGEGGVKSDSVTSEHEKGESAAEHVNQEGEIGAHGEGVSGDGEAGEGDGGESTEKRTVNEAPPTSHQSSKVTWQSLEPEWRRFNFDLIPKLLYCRGEMVDQIVESSCSRYIEFKAVTGIFSYSYNTIEQVPCSRSDVFSSKAVTMLEKRKMMKFLTFCSDFQSHPEEYQGSDELPFGDYLKEKGLTPNLVQYVLHSIAMVPNSATTLEGLQATKVFISSLGRYGNAPFLFPLFGGGELPQAFCRLSAVYGGVYCLQRHVSSIVTSTTDNTISSILCSSGQRIKCSSVVLSASFLTQTPGFSDCIKKCKISRGILVTDSPLPNTDGKLSLLTLPPGSLTSTHTAVRVLQLDHLSNSCAPGTFLVHMQCVSERETAWEDLQSAVRALFTDPLNNGDSSNSGPRVLWSLYYNVDLHSVDHTHSPEGPKGLYVTSEPDTTISYEKAANEAHELFAKMCPDEEFLPHPPNPDDIIFEDSDSNHGNGATAEGSEPANNSKNIEQETPPTISEATPTTTNNEPETTDQTE